MKLDVQVTKYEMRSPKHVYIAARIADKGWMVSRRKIDAAPIPPMTQTLEYIEEYDPNDRTKMDWIPVLADQHRGIVYFNTFPALRDFITEAASYEL